MRFSMNIKHKAPIKYLVFLIIGSVCIANTDYNGSYLPDLGDSDRQEISQSEANFLGHRVLQDITTQGSMLDDADTITYLNNLGNELVSYSTMAGYSFHFYLMNGEEINAFALPGGYICLYNGLIYTTHTEAELASVMSHEVGHIVQHHVFRNIAASNRNQWVALAGVLAGGLLSLANPAAAALAVQGGQGMAIQNMLSFSRDFEREADRVGQKLMYQDGFDPHAMPSFFKRLQDTHKFNDNQAYAFLRTHPVTSERIKEAEFRANQMPVRMRPDSNSFLLIREKAREHHLGPIAAINFYQKAIQTKKYVSLDAQYYGLAFAYFINHNPNKAMDSLVKIKDPKFIDHPIVLNLKAALFTIMKKYDNADQIYKDALEKFPSYKGLWLGQIDFYLQAKKLKDASTKLDDLSRIYANDMDIWIREAILYSDAKLDNPQRYHYALANQFYLKENYTAAIEQFEMALKVKNGDQILNDIINAKIIKLRIAIKENQIYINP